MDWLLRGQARAEGDRGTRALLGFATRDSPSDDCEKSGGSISSRDHEFGNIQADTELYGAIGRHEHDVARLIGAHHMIGSLFSEPWVTNPEYLLVPGDYKVSTVVSITESYL